MRLSTYLEEITNQAKTISQFFDLLITAAEDDNGLTLTNFQELFTSFSYSSRDMVKKLADLTDEAYEIIREENTLNATA